ncbi:MAG: hypothetical protein JST_000114 [Candidatus Parcubacteria bacterium]|jgi:hypothetical protein|nr:MAG: hypothetical protein JST_0980 [Candidatus Parcubacteria bacterium]
MSRDSSLGPASSLSSRRKKAVFSLSFLAVAILAAWFWQFNSRLTQPFTPSEEELALAQQAAEEKEAAALIERTKDTDNDGLTDWDEINIYKTSPYLVDTDGDGLSDFDEVRKGIDPLCAEGANCGLLTSNPESIVTPGAEITVETPASLIDEELLILALSGQGDADTIRQILLQGGASPEQVDLLSDEDLLLMYEEILAAQLPEVPIGSSGSELGDLSELVSPEE